MAEMEIPPRYRDKWDRMTYLAGEYRLPITILAGIVLVLAWRGGLPAIEVPGWVRTLALGIVYGSVPAYVVGLYIVRRWFPDPRDEIIELNLTDEGRISARTWLVPSEVWDDRQRGDRPELSPDEGAEAIVTQFDHMEDVDRISVEGANEELADPVSITTRQGRLEAVEETLLDKAEDLDKLEATVRTRAIEMQSEQIHALLAAVEEGTQMEPSALSEAFDEDMLSWQTRGGADERDRATNGDLDADLDFDEIYSGDPEVAADD